MLRDKFYLSARKQVEFFGIYSGIQWELETRELYEVLDGKAVCDVRALLLKGAARVARAYVS